MMHALVTFMLCLKQASLLGAMRSQRRASPMTRLRDVSPHNVSNMHDMMRVSIHSDKQKRRLGSLSQNGLQGDAYYDGS